MMVTINDKLDHFKRMILQEQQHRLEIKRFEESAEDERIVALRRHELELESAKMRKQASFKCDSDCISVVSEARKNKQEKSLLLKEDMMQVIYGKLEAMALDFVDTQAYQKKLRQGLNALPIIWSDHLSLDVMCLQADRLWLNDYVEEKGFKGALIVHALPDHMIGGMVISDQHSRYDLTLRSQLDDHLDTLTTALYHLVKQAEEHLV